MTVTDEVPPEYDLAKEFYAKYDIKNILGKGVSSTVRKCVEKKTGVEYAVKIIDLTFETEERGSNDELSIATKKEMNILRLCGSHPHIIEIHDTFESATFIFLVIEMCRKGELFDYLTEVVTFSEKRTRQIMKQLLDSLAFIHGKSIVHRDIKPENILLDDNMKVKLSDFGFATFVSSDVELKDLIGTPGYLAPEVLKISMYNEIKGYGKPVDMWACGVIMYTLLVGRPPFWHRKQLFMLRAIMEGNYSFASPEWNDVSDTAKDLISKFLTVDPDLRITAAQALVHPFFKWEEREEKVEEKKFPKRRFKAAVMAVFVIRALKNLRAHPPPILLEATRRDPYGTRAFRKAIDAGAFKIYGHWVKRGENQNRAALFDNSPKADLKMSQRQESTVNLMSRLLMPAVTEKRFSFRGKKK